MAVASIAVQSENFTPLICEIKVIILIANGGDS